MKHTNFIPMPPDLGGNFTSGFDEKIPKKSGRMKERFKRSFLILFLLSFISTVAFSNDHIWTGAVSTDWTVAGNWIGGVPNSPPPLSKIIISQNAVRTIDPVTVPNNVNFSYLEIQKNQTLTLNAGKTFTIDSAGIALLTGATLTVNAGATINIPTSARHGVSLDTSATLSNAGTISIMSVGRGDVGGFDGVNIGGPGAEVNNSGSLTIKGVDPIGETGSGIVVDTGFLNNSGTICIDSVADHGILNKDSVINSGTIKIDSTNMEGSQPGHGIYDSIGTAFFRNLATGVITIKEVRGTSHGIFNEAGTFSNEGSITIDDTGGNGVQSGAPFRNAGDLTIGTNPVTGGGIVGIDMNGILVNAASTFRNAENGCITIGDTTKPNVVGSGIQLVAASTVTDSAKVSIHGVTGDGVFVMSGTYNQTDDGQMTISTTMENGIEVMAGQTFNQDDNSSITITNSMQNGIENNGRFISDGSTITIGDGSLTGIMRSGILNTDSFSIHSTTAGVGGVMCISGVTLDGIRNDGTGSKFRIGDDLNMPGDSLATVKIDSTGEDGIDNADGSICIREASRVYIGINGGGITFNGIFNRDTINVRDNGTRLIIDGNSNSIENTGRFYNNTMGTSGDCVIVEAKNDIQVTSGEFSNDAIFCISAPFNTSGGATNLFDNNGIVIDSMGSLFDTLTNLPLRSLHQVVDNAGGVVVGPYLEECYRDSIPNVLIAAVNNVSGYTYLPSASWTTSAGQAVGTFNATDNSLKLSMTASPLRLNFDVVANGVTCLTKQMYIHFDNITQPAVACNDNVQVSLNGNCFAVISPDVILEGDYPCYNGYSVQLLEGAKAGTDTVDASYIGQTVRVQVTGPHNTCWGTITVEDKIPPILFCRDTTIFCGKETHPDSIGGRPGVADGCEGTVTFTFADQTQNFGCRPGGGNNPDTISMIVRTWTGTDQSGNSSQCVQNIYVLKPQLRTSNILWPADDTLYCANNPDTGPANTGYPRVVFNNDTIDVNEFCLIGLNYQDQEFTTDCEGAQKILRVWTLFDWCHPDSVFTNAVNPGPQLIKVVDTVGPVISDLPFANEIQISFTGSLNCVANVTVPPITVSDECSSVGNISVSVTLANTTINTNGGLITGVPYGTQNVIYIAQDDCGNISRDTVQIDIQDNIAPTVICKRNITVSLTQDGTAIAHAIVFDDGSYDNCEIDSIRVRRMTSCLTVNGNDGLTYSEYVPFGCCDLSANPVMVELAVWDTSGNFNSCMVEVEVQDKVPPTLICPSDVTVDCTSDLVDLAQFGEAVVFGGACQPSSMDLEEVRNLDNCGKGVITRTWTVPGTTISCTQTITVNLVQQNQFNVTRPDSMVLLDCDAGVDITALEQDDFVNGDTLIFSSSVCQLLAVNYSQQVFTSEGTCLEVLRQWIIIDWCQNPTADPTQPGYEVITQVIKLIDTEAPVINPFTSPVTFDANQLTCDGTVILPRITATDDCANSVNISINGTIGTQTFTGASEGDQFDNVPVGTYDLLYIVEDGCNNIATASLTIIVEDTQGPAIFCDDLVTTLNLNDNATDSITRGEVTVWASDFTCKITDCDITEGAVRTVLRFPSIDAVQKVPPSDTSFGVTFNCSHVGAQILDLWASDAAGNWNHVKVTLEIQDNQDICNITPDTSGGDLSRVAMINGSVSNEVGEMIEDVTIQIMDYDMLPLVTGPNGIYQFDGLPMHLDYTIFPEKDMNHLNGVSTFDLVLISKHILGISELDSPYKWIAADINKSSTITAYDMVQLRQLILNVTTEFPNNTSWRFVDAGYEFTSDNPLSEAFGETVKVSNLLADTKIDFVAVKVGDVSGNALANQLLGAESRNFNGTVTIQLDEKAFAAGEVFRADFVMPAIQDVEGYQFTLKANSDLLELVDIEPGVASKANFGMMLSNRGILTTSWNKEANAPAEDRLFTAVFKAREAGKLSQALTINSDLTVTEAYDADGELLNVDLNYNTPLVSDKGFKLYQNTPNPFRATTRISFELPEATAANLTIFDISGRVVKTMKGEFNAGYNEVTFDKADLNGTGIYYYQLQTPLNTAKRKMILID